MASLSGYKPKVFITNPITRDELIKWNKNKLENPRTSRRISNDSKVYKYIDNEYNKIFKLELIDSIDDKDPITLTPFWIIKDDKKIITYDNHHNLILYRDSHNLVRCFEKDSLEYLKAHKMNKHPITNEIIPEEVFNKVGIKDLETERKSKSINDYALEVFQKFSTISIFIDSEWFMNLDKNKLLKFNYELRDFYAQNLSNSQKNDISKEKLMSFTNSDLEDKSNNEIQKYLLDQMNIMLDTKKEETRYMANYILVGALGIVIPDIKELYPDIAYSFV
jgi:hypothetical protein